MVRWLNTSPWRLVGPLAFGAALFAVGCGDPCYDLSKTICRCYTTDLQQQGCVSALDADAQGDRASEEEQAVCQEILDAKTCTCDALAEGDLAACGLAVDTGS